MLYKYFIIIARYISKDSIKRIFWRINKGLCATLTQMLENMLEDCCYKYCDQTFANRTKKLSHKNCICKQCEITFSHSVELHIHTHKKKNYMESATEKLTKQVPVSYSLKSKPQQWLDCQALPYKCTECSHQGEKKYDVIDHIKNKHKAI